MKNKALIRTISMYPFLWEKNLEAEKEYCESLGFDWNEWLQTKAELIGENE